MYHKYVKFTLEIRHNSIDGERVGFWGYSEAYATFRKYQKLFEQLILSMKSLEG